MRDEADAEKRLAQAELVSATESQQLAAIELRRAQEQLALRTMISPFNGVVLDRMLNPGDLAEAGSGRKPVLRVAQIDPLKVDIVAPGLLLGAIKPGARAVVTAKGAAGRHVATVAMIDKVIDPASGTDSCAWSSRSAAAGSCSHRLVGRGPSPRPPGRPSPMTCWWTQRSLRGLVPRRLIARRVSHGAIADALLAFVSFTASATTGPAAVGH